MVNVVSGLHKGLFIYLLIVAALVAKAAEYVPQARTGPDVMPASNEGELAIKKFRPAPGLKVDLWAAEPLLVQAPDLCAGFLYGLWRENIAWHS